MKRLQPLFLGALLAFGTAIAQAQATAPARNANPHNTPSTPGAAAQILPDFADLVDKYGPAVVNINTQTRVQRPQLPNGLSEDDPFYEFFKKFLPPEQQQQVPQGRGRRGIPGQPGQAQPETPRGPLR